MKKKEKQVTSNYSVISLIPIILFVALIPLIIRLKKINYPMVGYDWYPDTKVFYDFFSYYRSVWVIILTTVAVLILIYKIINKKFVFKMTNLYFPLIAYAFFVILSWMMSKHFYTATRGYVERYEGIFVLLCYLIMFFYIINTVNNKNDVKLLIKSLIVSVLIMNIIGLFQFLKLDIFRSSSFIKFLTPKVYWPLLKNLNFEVPNGQVYQTLYHSNYVGLYIALVLPFTTTFFICTNDFKKKIAWGLLSVLLFVNLIGSISRGGLIGIAFAIVISLIFLRKKIFKWWQHILIVLFVGIIAFIGMDKVSSGFFSNRTKSIVSNLFEKPIKFPLESIETDNTKIHIVYKNQPLDIVMDTDHITKGCQFMDENKKVLKTSFDKNIYFINDKRFKDYKFQYAKWENKLVLQVILADNSKWNFALTKNGIYFINPFGKMVSLKKVDTWGFKGKERMGSARGYIWSRSIPLLKKTFFVGTGPDTFALVFPQNDYVGKYNAYHTPNMIVDKPHNIYLQAAINTGVISLIALLVFWIMYFVWCCKLYFKNDFNDFYSIAGVGIFIGFCGYLAAGMFNDTNVSVSPVFWGLLGIGTAINLMLEKNMQKE